ncbi:MAG: hypothetical protein IPH37_10675 [Burkholderiales bacterium]|nr:hypothetical protein [Burkholderiales bacterium]
MNPLKRLHPQLSKLVAQLVYAKHKAQAEREVEELRGALAELIRRGSTSEELCKALLAADPDKLTIAKQN